jgi:S-adenosylmethionine hydrolase
LIGQVTSIDRFGNLLTDITARHLEDVRAVTQGGTLTISIAGSRIDGLVSSYSEGFQDQPAALINSSGALEVFVKEGSAADLIKIQVGEQIRIG